MRCEVRLFDDVEPVYYRTHASYKAAVALRDV